MYDITFADFLVSLAITAFAYLLVPIIAVASEREVNAKKVTIINGIVVCIIFMVIEIETTGQASPGGAVFLWSGVGYAIMKKWCSPKPDINKVINSVGEDMSTDEPCAEDTLTDPESNSLDVSEDNIHYSISDNSTNPTHGDWHITGKDLMLQPITDSEPTIQPDNHVYEQEEQSLSNSAKNEHIGNTPNNSDACSKWETVAIASIIALVISIFICFSYSQEVKLQDDIIQKQTKFLNEGKDLGLLVERVNGEYMYLSTEYKKLKKFYKKNKDKVDFMDDNIVLVLDGYGNYYYTYDQAEKVTGGSYSYWAYNKEAAISKGYVPWKK